jgi:hypothetical protein
MYKRVEKFDIQKVYVLCVNENYYTRGTNEDYERMFEMCHSYAGVDDVETVEKISEDIVNHSEVEEGMSKLEMKELIMYRLLGCMISYFDKEE